MQTIGCLFVRGGAHASLDRLSNDRIKITKQQNARWYYGKSFVRLHTIEWKSACKWVHFYVHTHGITSFFRAVFFLSWPARYLEVYFIVYFLLLPLLFSSNFTMQFFFVDLSLSLCNRFMNLVVVSGGEIAQNRKPMQWDCTMGDVVASHSKCQAACELND